MPYPQIYCSYAQVTESARVVGAGFGLSTVSKVICHAASLNFKFVARKNKIILINFACIIVFFIKFLCF